MSGEEDGVLWCACGPWAVGIPIAAVTRIEDGADARRHPIPGLAAIDLPGAWGCDQEVQSAVLVRAARQQAMLLLGRSLGVLPAGRSWPVPAGLLPAASPIRALGRGPDGRPGLILDPARLVAGP